MNQPPGLIEKPLPPPTPQGQAEHIKKGTLFPIPDSPNTDNVNQKGWLPPCRPFGRRWRGQLNSYTHTRPVAACSGSG
ncbi:MAG: hypothetical protein P1P80_10270 [ANME-2 cluster archaeon]|nr:hypothetical protein [ANME-2 cluster archaeon]